MVLKHSHFSLNTSDMVRFFEPLLGFWKNHGGIGQPLTGKWCAVARSNLDLCRFAGYSSRTHLWTGYLCSDGVQCWANCPIGNEFVSNFRSMFEGNVAKKGRKGAKIVYFVDAESFHAPTCMVPDFGNPSDWACLQVTPRSEWASQFSDWLQTKHKREFPRT